MSTLQEETRDWVVHDRMFREANMYRRIADTASEQNLPQTAAALPYASEKHRGQTRKGHERIPYINHPLLVTCHAMALGITEDSVLAACLLHDVCEDCGVRPEDLPVEEHTKETVRLVTKGDWPEAERGRMLERYYEGISHSRDAMIVKMLDRCNNISDMTSAFCDSKMAEYINETERYVMPLLNTLRKKYPETGNAVFLVKYQMRTVLTSLKRMLYEKAEANPE